jgi:hypothetical protein
LSGHKRRCQKTRPLRSATNCDCPSKSRCPVLQAPGSNRSSIEVAGPRIECRHPVAQTAVATGAPDNDGILKRERCRRELEVGLVEKVLVPHDLAGLLVGGDDAASIACNRDHERAPQSNAAIAVLVSKLWVHLPHDGAGGAGAHVDFIDHAPAIDHVHEPIVDQRCRFEAVGGRFAGKRDSELKFQILDVRLVDQVEHRIALCAEVVMVHQPILRLGIEQALIGDIGRSPRGACQQ